MTSGTNEQAPTWHDVALQDVYEARERISALIHRTPMLTSATLGRMTNTDLHLKAEMFQRTGSFKVRGALNAAIQLSDEQKARGIITFSAGNHGQGIAYAARMVGCRALIFMPKDATPAKVEAIQGYGAETRFVESMEGILDVIDTYQRDHGMTFISPFNHPHIVAGQGTVGLEILEDVPEVETIVVPIGGGGLVSGIAMTIKSLKPDVRIVGVEPEGANIVKRSLESGKIEQAHDIHTIADGLAAPAAGELTQAIIRHYVDDVVLVSEDEIAQANRLILMRQKVLVEPSGAAATAALLAGKCGARVGGSVVSVLSGGNIDEAKLARILTM
ncbi:MAG: pyridoxal-phosphate dependent enzyme [Thermomicrobiales bacterium]|nr:pyridoxal-phosphate dependent enzyme [Thermomicrobiales bacterium]